MAVQSYTRTEIEALVERMLARAHSPLLNDMPELQRDIRAMAMILGTLLALGVELERIELQDLYYDRSRMFPTRQ